MTYKQLETQLKRLSPEQLEMDVTISLDLSKEAIPAKYLHEICDDDFLEDVLDVGHPIIAIDF